MSALSFSNTAHLHVFARDDGSGSNDSYTTIIIAVVCGIVGGAILLVILWRTVAWARRPPSAPLPPVQPLAHHREQQSAAFADHPSRPATWFDAPSLSGSYKPYPQGSIASLTPATPTRKGSWNTMTEETTDMTMSDLASEAMEAPSDDYALPLPRPHFRNESSSPLRLRTERSTSSLSSYEKQHTSSPSLPGGSSSELNSNIPLRIPRLNSTPGAPRPISTADSFSTTYTTRSRTSTFRGPPHSRLSNIHIVMPAPLAPDAYVYGAEGYQDVSHYSVASDADRYSVHNVSDSWLGPSRPGSQSRGSPQAGERTPYRQQSTPSERRSPSLSRGAQRDPSRSPGRSSSLPLSTPPPFPPVPTIHHPRPIAAADPRHSPLEDIPERGRQRAPSRSNSQTNKLQKKPSQRSPSRKSKAGGESDS